MIDCTKCIHYLICDNSRDYVKYEECSHYKEERPHGEWKRTDNRWGVGILQCTHCEKFYEIATKFCPNCGASMVKEGEENE